MPIAEVEKIYDKEEIREFNSLEKQWNSTIPYIFENARLVSDFVSLSEKFDALESVFGMLNELSPEQRESFEEAVKRRPLFK